MVEHQEVVCEADVCDVVYFAIPVVFKLTISCVITKDTS